MVWREIPKELRLPRMQELLTSTTVMAKMIRLPSGISIDMEQGEIRTPLGPGPIPISHNTGTHVYRRTVWNRFDRFIGNIGNWFADYSERITSILSIVLLAGMGISFLIWLISLGLFWGIVAGILLGGIVYYAAMIVVGIFTWISNILLGIIRYIFYSGTTFLIALAVMGIFAGVSALPERPWSVKTETAAPQTTLYYCTARSSLNVRSAPDLNAEVVGSLKFGDAVEVYGMANGFAKIKYNGAEAYASADYLKKKEER